MKRTLSVRSPLDKNFRHSHTTHKQFQLQRSSPLPLPSNLTAEILSFLDIERIRELRQVNSAFKTKIVPNAYREIVIDQVSLEKSARSVKAMVTEAVSICEVTLKCINLSTLSPNAKQVFITLLNLLLAQHGQKIRTLELSDMRVNSIFDVDQFCKGFVIKLIQQEASSFSELRIKNCQSMFIEKFLFKVSEHRHVMLTRIELSEVNLEQVEHALTQYLSAKTDLQELRINAINTPHSSTVKVETSLKENTAFDNFYKQFVSMDANPWQ